MNNFYDFYLKELYNKFILKDRLCEIDSMIDWESLRPLVKELYKNNTEIGGRPNIDEIVMIKNLFLQGMYNLSDEATEKEILDRISFWNALLDQLKAKGISVKTGIIQDATFVTSDPGHGKHKKEEVVPMDSLFREQQQPIMAEQPKKEKSAEKV